MKQLSFLRKLLFGFVLLPIAILSCKANPIIESPELEQQESDGVLKLLAIGNSFSDDALEHHLHGLALATGKKLIIGHLRIGGSSLNLHWQNASNNKPAYTYNKINVDGFRTSTPNTAISDVLDDEEWEYISLQQVSQHSGLFNTFTKPLPLLVDYLKQALEDEVKLILHQTWAYAKNTTHAGWANYDNDQLTMYQAIVSTVNQAKELVDADIIVPSGTAIQNGRTSVIGDNFCRDGFHLDVNIGRYTASATWYEILFGESVIGNSYKPKALSAYEAEIAQHAAHFAVLQPNAATEMVDYKKWDNIGEPTTDILVNFGAAGSSAEYWNTMTGINAPSRLTNLKDKNGTVTEIAIEIVEGFHARNNNGAKSTDILPWSIPPAVSSSSLYGNINNFQDKKNGKKCFEIDRIE